MSEHTSMNLSPGAFAEKLQPSRRTFVKTALAAGTAMAAAGATGTLTAVADEMPANAEDQGVTYVRSTCSPNCTGSCGLVASVKDGKICTIVQASDYGETEHNPRGCLKGTSRNADLYGPDRLLYPMVRDGKYSEGGQLRRATWDEALDRAAEIINEITDKYGADSICTDYQAPPLNYINKGTFIRLVNLAGWSNFPGVELDGDLPMFYAETVGCGCEELESYQWADSRLTLDFGSNLCTTRLPDFHMIERSQEAGGKFIYFDPNYTVTASKADEWVRPAPGTDIVVALAMAKTIIDDGTYDRDYITTYTDLPILVNPETHKRILSADVQGLDRPADTPENRESFVCWRNGAPALVDPTQLGEMPDVELEGTFNVPMKDGSTVAAKPVFQMLREHLEMYTPEYAEEISTVPAETTKRLARMVASIKPTHIICGGSAHQWHHGDLKGRALILLVALTGNIGTLGGGISDYVGQYKVRFKPASWFIPTNNNARNVPYHYFVNGPTENMKAPYPKNGFRMFIAGWANPFDQQNNLDVLRSRREDGTLEYVIACDFMYTTTVDYADVVLPGVSWWEKTDVVTTPLHPYIQLQQKAADAPGEARPEIWIFSELARRINPEWGSEFPEFEVEQSEEIIEQVLQGFLEKGGDTVAGITIEELRQGPVKLRHPNDGDKRIPFWDQIHNHVPFPPAQLPNAPGSMDKFVKSGRMEFYKDESLFIQEGEELPVYKPLFEDTEYAADPTARERFPFIYLTRNSLYRVHTGYSSNSVLLELQDNLPHIWMNPDDAAEKGFVEGDHVEAYNDRGKVAGKLVLEPGLWPKQLVFEMGWWARHTNGDAYNSLIYPWINPVHEQFFLGATWSTNMAWNECVCDVRKADE